VTCKRGRGGRALLERKQQEKIQVSCICSIQEYINAGRTGWDENEAASSTGQELTDLP